MKMMLSPSPEPQYRKEYSVRRFVLFIVITVLLTMGTILWILNIIAVITGPWASILSAIFTALTVLFAFFEWYRSIKEQHASPPQEMFETHANCTELGLTKRRGALVIWARKDLSGATIHLYKGFDIKTGPIAVAANIIELKNTQGASFFEAILPSLEPGRYTASLPEFGHQTNITINPERVAVIDWRRIRSKHRLSSLLLEGKR